MTVKEPHWTSKHNGDMLQAEAWLQKEWAALPLGLKVVVFLLAVLGVVVGAEWHNRLRIEAWYHAHQLPVILAAVLVALIAAYPLFLLARHRWRHRKVERHLERIKQLQQSQARIDAGLGFAGSTMTNRLLERERQKLAKRLNQTPPPKEPEPEELVKQLPDVIPWERPQVHSCLDPVVVGAYPDGAPMRIGLTPEPGQQLNLLVAGMSGYGKTTLLNALIAHYAYCEDAALAMVDVMGGGFHRWRRLAADGWYADKDEEVKPVLDRIKGEMEHRARHLQAKQDRDEEPIWDPRADGADVFLFIDEGADLVGIPDAYDVLFEIARKGRKVGVHTIYATQRPSADVIPTTLRSQLQVRVSLRVMTSTDGEVVFGPGSVHAGWRPHDIPRDGRGIAVLEVPTSDVTQVPGRTIRMLPDQVRLVVEDRAGHQPPPRSKPPIPPPTEPPPSPEGVRCKVCQEPFPDVEAVTQHWRDEHSKKAREGAPSPPPPEPERPPEGLSPMELKSWCRERTWALVKAGDVRGRPHLCENGCGTALTSRDYPHHWDYTDPTKIGWFCRPCHEEADKARRQKEGSNGWTKAQASEALDLYETMRSWKAVGDRYGISARAASQRCRRAFPGHLAFKAREPKPSHSNRYMDDSRDIERI